MTETSAPERWRLILVPHTHWDREWYFPFQRYRTRLVGFFDLLLDILERDPEYRHFMLDGHTILVEDYLEVRPDRREQIERKQVLRGEGAGPAARQEEGRPQGEVSETFAGTAERFYNPVPVATPDAKIRLSEEPRCDDFVCPDFA